MGLDNYLLLLDGVDVWEWIGAAAVVLGLIVALAVWIAERTEEDFWG